MARKKVVFIIVEGETDREALELLLEKIYNTDLIYVHVMRGDITSKKDISPSTIIKKIVEQVKHYAQHNGLNRKDFKEIIHIIDTDGAFVPDDKVFEDRSLIKTMYFPDRILAKNRNNIVMRNKRKSANLNVISVKDKIWIDVTYRVYYMSCNLDHVLYNKLNLEPDEKEKNANNFAENYKDNTIEFIQFISNSDFSIMDDYTESWKYIKKEQHSLERHTNLGICFQNKDSI